MTSTVSRETNNVLNAYADELLKWNKRLNLIGRASSKHMLERHLEDSAQLNDLVLTPQLWTDLGSGGGLPGIVIAILNRDIPLKVVCVESDKRKAAFLRHVVNLFDLKANIIVDRIEAVAPIKSDVITARALAPLPKLLRWASRHGRPDTTYIFPKGETANKEITAAREEWSFTLEKIPSRTSAVSTILKIRDLSLA